MSIYSFSANDSARVDVYDRRGGTLLGSAACGPLPAVLDLSTNAAVVAVFYDGGGKWQGDCVAVPGINSFAATMATDEAEPVDQNPAYLEIDGEVKRLLGLVSCSNASTLLHVASRYAPGSDVALLADKDGSSVVPLTLTAAGVLISDPITASALNLRGAWV